MTDDYEDAPRKSAPPKPKRRRRRIYISGWKVRTVITILGLGVIVWGGVLGDVWLWRLLYG